MRKPPRSRRPPVKAPETLEPDLILRCQGCGRRLRVTSGTSHQQGKQIAGAGWVVAGAMQGKDAEYRCGGCWRAAEYSLLAVAREA